MKRKFNHVALSFIVAMLMIFQPLMQSVAHASEAGSNLGTVYVTVGDHTERDPKVLNSTKPKDEVYKQPFGDIVAVTVPIAEGDTMYDSIRKALETKGIKCYTTGQKDSVYISGIGPVTSQDGKRTVNKLSEFDGGRWSGWMGSLNDWYVNMGFGNWKVTDGDIIHMEYTCQGLGQDLGQWWDTNNPPDTSLKSIEVIGGKLDKSFDSSVKYYTITVPAGTTSVQLNQTATNKANNAQIFVGDKSYKRFRDIPVSKDTKIEVYCGKSLSKDLNAPNTVYTFTVKEEQPPVTSVSNEELDAVVEGVSKWYKHGNSCLMNSDFLECAGSTAGDWLPIGAARYGIKDNYQAYLDAVSKYVTEKYQEDEKLAEYKATEWERIALAVGAAGGDPTKIGKDDKGNPINLIADGTYNSVVDYDDQGINAYVFGLIALDSRNYPVPEGSRYTRESIIKGILSSQIACGGYQYGSEGGAPGKADPDMTAMAVQALAPYYKDNKAYAYTCGNKEVTKTVHQVVDEALESIRVSQKPDGDFASWGTTNVESTDQVIVALCALGTDPEKDPRFITSAGKTPVNGLMKYVMKDGGIAHTLETGSNPMATDQTLYTLAAIKRQRAGMNRLYDYRDAKYMAARPVITEQPQDKTLNEGEEFTLSVSASTADNGTLSYQWYKDGKAMDGAKSSTCKVSDAKKTDSGSYYVIVTNTLNDATESVSSSNAQITVTEPETVKPVKPVISKQPQGKTLNEGEEFALSVSASTTDKGTLSYQWYKDGKAMDGATSSICKASNAKEADSGIYYVMVTNTLNDLTETATSTSVTVKVNKAHPSQSDEPSQPSQIYTTDKDPNTGVSSLEIPVATIKGTKDKSVCIQVEESPLRVNIPTCLLTGDSKGSIRFQHKDSAVNSPLPGNGTALCTPFDLLLHTIERNGNATKISEFGNDLVTFTFNIGKDKLSQFKLDTIALYYHDGTKWVKASDAKCDENTGIVTVGTSRFSTFALVGESKGDADVNADVNADANADVNADVNAHMNADEITNESDMLLNDEGLPQTGSAMDAKALILSGLGVMAAGMFVASRRRLNIK